MNIVWQQRLTTTTIVIKNIIYHSVEVPFTELLHRKLNLQVISLVELPNTVVKTDKYYDKYQRLRELIFTFSCCL